MLKQSVLLYDREQHELYSAATSRVVFVGITTASKRMKRKVRELIDFSKRKKRRHREILTTQV